MQIIHSALCSRKRSASSASDDHSSVLSDGVKSIDSESRSNLKRVKVSDAAAVTIT